MAFNVRDIDLAKLDSATKYPSIPTYHELDKSNGNLSEPVVPFAGEVFGSEKIDGTNARIILLPDESYIIGSRAELLHGQGDLVINPALGIVDVVKPIADKMSPMRDGILIFFGEVYGHGVGSASRQYATANETGFRLFDVVRIDNADEILSWDRAKIASWRQHGGQKFASTYDLTSYAALTGLQLVPALFQIDASELPTSLDDMQEFLRAEVPMTFAGFGGRGGKAEGIVLRSADRSVIAKARHEDYAKTARRQQAKR